MELILWEINFSNDVKSYLKPNLKSPWVIINTKWEH